MTPAAGPDPDDSRPTDAPGRPAPPPRATRHRYHAFDGQDPFTSQLDTRDLLDRIGDDLLQGFSGREALQHLLDEGFDGVSGLDELRRRIAQQRRDAQAATESGAGRMLADLQRELDEIIDLEREARASEDDPLAAMELDLLPRDPAGRMAALSQQSMRSKQARERLQALRDRVTKDLLDAQMAQLTAGMASVTPDDLARTREMLTDLNALVAQRERGDEPDLDGFLDKWEDFFPERPESLDELLAQLAARMAAMSRLLASLPPDQRQQLMDLQRQLLDDPDLQFQMMQLEDAMRDLAPNLPWDQVQGDGQGVGSGFGNADEWDPFGSGDASFSSAVDQVQRLSELEELEESLGGHHAGATLDDIDEDSLRRELGDAAADDLRRLKEVERALEESGAMRRRGGQLELTPRGARLLGQQALNDLLQKVRKEPSRTTMGSDPEPTGGTRPWQFGDREPIATVRTIHNAVLRHVAGGGATPSPAATTSSTSSSATSSQSPNPAPTPASIPASTPASTPGSAPRLRLHPDDIEVEEQEVRPRTATALLLDLSWSMPLQGHLVPAKRMALALHALVTGSHRQDSLHLIGFSDYARRLEPADLSATGFDRVYGTNMHHAFLLARRILMDDPRPIKQVIMVTDGEPTAHLVGGQSWFNWPPIPETLEATLREAKRLARSNISLDVFLLEDSHGLVAFSERLAAITGGSVTQLRGDELGRHIVTDYDLRRQDW